MSYQAIARKWRPRNFDEVTGQEHITQTLRNALENDRLHHAYLFSGARGVGKTTTARLLAKSLNCHKTDKPNVLPCPTDDKDACASCIEISESRSMDVLEIDAASHTGIDDVRDTIIENITVNPARDRYKVFIIDEVHQLSKPAFNALLKTLEEPPSNVVFIMATTEPRKVPDTILSRCQDFQFRTISLQKIFDRLKLIAEAEKIVIADDALREIARSGEGSMRDAQSNFDQAISFSGEKISVEDVSSALGIASFEMLAKVAAAIADRQPKSALEVVDELIAGGQDLRIFCRDLMGFFRDLLVYKFAGGATTLLEGSVLDAEQMAIHSSHFSESDLIRLFNSLADTEIRLKDATQQRIALEIGLIKLIEMRRLAAMETIIERLTRLEEAFSTGRPHSAQTDSEEKKTLKSELTPSKILLADENVHEPSEAVPAVVPARTEIPIPIVHTNFLDPLPTKLPPIEAEAPEHFEDTRLDNAYETVLERSGDDLAPIPEAVGISRAMIGNSSPSAERPLAQKSANGYAAATAPAREFPKFTPPVSETDSHPSELQTLSENPTDAEMLAYAEAHPMVKKAMRIFRARIVEVKKA